MILNEEFLEKKGHTWLDCVEETLKESNILPPDLSEKKKTVIPGFTGAATGGLRYNEGKVQWGLLNYKALEPMIRVLMFGAKKYSPNNWQKGLSKREILESMQRHLASMMDGEEIDPESGLPHIGHIGCNYLFYSYFTTVDSTNSRD